MRNSTHEIKFLHGRNHLSGGKMKVLFVGVFNDRSTNNAQADGFEKHGCEVIRYDYREAHKLLESHTKRDLQLIAYVLEKKPEIVLFSKCNGVSVEVINVCNEVGAATVLWYMDP